MAETNFRGPLNAIGSLEVEAGTAATIEPFDGPSGFYQTIAMLDPRSAPFAKDGTSPGRAPAFLANPDFWACDNKPQATNATCLAASAVQTSLVAMPLATTQVSNPNAGSPFIAVGVPILPQGTTTIVNVIALDFGFSTGTTTANSSTVAVYDSTKFTQGQWICIGGAGAANQASFFTQVQSIGTSNTTTITVAPLPPAASSSAPIGQANIFGAGLYPPATQFGPSAVAATYHSPNIQAGLLRVHNSAETLARNVSVTLATGGVATVVTFLVSGYDVWRAPMTELISVPATTSATTAYGQKAFKYIASVTPQSASTGGNSYAVGIGDTFGFPFRADEWEQTNSFWAGTASANSTGFTACATAVPATNTTGDVRGTIQVGAAGKGSAVTGTLSANGTSRLALIQNLGIWNVVFGTPNNTVPMFGVAQSTT
jgi:hypothetical protein